MQTEPDRYNGEDIRFRGDPYESVSDERVNIHKSEWYRVRQEWQPFVSEYSIEAVRDGRLLFFYIRFFEYK